MTESGGSNPPRPSARAYAPRHQVERCRASADRPHRWPCGRPRQAAARDPRGGASRRPPRSPAGKPSVTTESPSTPPTSTEPPSAPTRSSIAMRSDGGGARRAARRPAAPSPRDSAGARARRPADRHDRIVVRIRRHDVLAPTLPAPEASRHGAAALGKTGPRRSGSCALALTASARRQVSADEVIDANVPVDGHEGRDYEDVAEDRVVVVKALVGDQRPVVDQVRDDLVGALTLSRCH
jgi:hypothetical protein